MKEIDSSQHTLDKIRIEHWTGFFVVNFTKEIIEKDIEKVVMNAFENHENLPNDAPLDLKWKIIEILEEIDKEKLEEKRLNNENRN